jgi:hypothetical protein
LKKEKTLTIGSKLEVAEGGDVDGDEGVDKVQYFYFVFFSGYNNC